MTLPVAPIALVEAVATLLWVYAGLAGLEWAARALRLERSRHIPAAADLISHLVPGMIMVLVVVLFGAFIGFPSVVVILAILFPAALATGLQMALNDVREAAWPGEVIRLLLAGAIGAVVIWFRQAG